MWASAKGMTMKVPALIISTALALGGATLFSANAEAAVAYTFTTSPISYDTQLSLGFTFTANVNFDVTSLGYYNGLPGGFLTPHEVGIFAGDGAVGPGPLWRPLRLLQGHPALWVLTIFDIRRSPRSRSWPGKPIRLQV